jgi:PadR family transcriptional regulator PadR
MAGVARLSAIEHLILELLLRGGNMYGLELVAASKGRLKRGTVYVTLGRMEEKGLIESSTDEARGGVAVRRLYRPTASGLRLLKAWRTLSRTLALEPIL